MTQTPLTVRRWSRFEYERLVESGFFEGDPVELVAGQLIVSEPQGSYHVTVVSIVANVFRAVLPPGWIVREEKPISLDEDSAPEPDIAIVPGTYEDYLNAHPTVPPLVIEVADTSLVYDRRVKASVYARAGVGDYWIVNISARTLEIYREPSADASASAGWSYRSVRTLGPGASVAPLALPSTRVAVASLLPRGGA